METSASARAGTSDSAVEELAPFLSDAELDALEKNCALSDSRRGSRVVRDARQSAYEMFRMAMHEDPWFASLRPDVRARMQTFLLALARLSYQTKACAVTGINSWTVRNWRKGHPRFTEYESIALEAFVEVMEQEADRRGMEGWLEPVFSHKTGEMLGHVRKFDSRLLEMRLKALDPDKYADRRKTELTGANGGPIQVQPVIDTLREKLDRLRKDTP